jgi:predicted unusual protein kinase regulating ubiquinone biosynthesis (AarF/ABC1/UbiB family)
MFFSATNKYKARIRRGPVLEAAIGKVEAAIWGGRTVAIKIQRPGWWECSAFESVIIIHHAN